MDLIISFRSESRPCITMMYYHSHMLHYNYKFRCSNNNVCVCVCVRIYSRAPLHRSFFYSSDIILIRGKPINIIFDANGALLYLLITRFAIKSSPFRIASFLCNVPMCSYTYVCGRTLFEEAVFTHGDTHRKSQT